MPQKRPTRFPGEPQTVRKAKEHIHDVKVLDKHKHLMRMNLLPKRRTK